eukprot:795103-Prorocentrum_minimum.AAC.3
MVRSRDSCSRLPGDRNNGAGVGCPKHTHTHTHESVSEERTSAHHDLDCLHDGEANAIAEGRVHAGGAPTGDGNHAHRHAARVQQPLVLLLRDQAHQRGPA